MHKYLLFCCSIILFSGFSAGNPVDSLLSVLPKLEGKAAFTAEEKLIGLMYVAAPEPGLQLSRKYIAFADKHRLTSLKIKTLIHSYRFFELDEQLRRMQEAEQLAHAARLPNLIPVVYNFKAIVFRDASMADSAMIYALRAKDLFEEEHANMDALTGILMLIGDMHFYAGEYNDAEVYYTKVLSTMSPSKIHWRKVTLINNLGLIRIQQKRYDEAEQYFNKTIEYLSGPNIQSVDSVGFVYTYRKLMEVALLKKDYSKAEQFYREGHMLALRFNQKRELTGLYIGRAELLFYQNNFRESVELLKKAEIMEKEFPDLKYKSDLYRISAMVFGALGDFKSESLYLERLVRVNKTADSLYNRTKILHLYAQHNYLNSLKQLDTMKRENTLLFAILFLVALSLAIFIFYFIRLRGSYRMLVNKNLELANVENAEPIGLVFDEPAPSADSTLSDDLTETAETAEEKAGLPQDKKEPDSALIEKIIAGLEKLVLEEKVFLDGNLTAYKLAALLETNRTYLALAIKSKYNMNFSEFINGHRVKEVIRLIASGEHKLLGLDGIFQKAGFNNRVTFNKAFQQHTGVTPSFFVRNISLPAEGTAAS